MLLPRRGLKKCIHAVSNFIALIPFRSIRQIKVNYSGFKFENFLPNIRKRDNRCLVLIPHKTKIRTFYIVFVLRIRRQLKSVPRHFFLSGLFLFKVFLKQSTPHCCLECRCSLVCSKQQWTIQAFISGCRQLNIIMQFVALFN